MCRFEKGITMPVLIIAGTRYPKITDESVRDKIKKFNGNALVHIEKTIRDIGPDDLLMISGACKNSPDMLIKVFPMFLDEEKSWYAADWDSFGKRAGMIRNAKMAENATHLLAFWDGESSGTKNMIFEAKKRNLGVRVVRFDYNKVFG